MSTEQKLKEIEERLRNDLDLAESFVDEAPTDIEFLLELVKLMQKELDCLYSVLSEDPMHDMRTSYTQWFRALELKEKRKKLENDNA